MPNDLCIECAGSGELEDDGEICICPHCDGSGIEEDEEA